MAKGSTSAKKIPPSHLEKWRGLEQRHGVGSGEEGVIKQTVKMKESIRRLGIWLDILNTRIQSPSLST